MRSPILRILVLAWLGAWFGVIVPGHTRGQITIDGSRSHATGGCCVRPPAEAERHGPGGDGHVPDQQPSPQDRARCAVCFVAVRLEQPTLITIQLPAVGLLDVLPVPGLRPLSGVELVATPLGRGPPRSLMS